MQVPPIYPQPVMSVSVGIYPNVDNKLSKGVLHFFLVYANIKR